MSINLIVALLATVVSLYFILNVKKNEYYFLLSFIGYVISVVNLFLIDVEVCIIYTIVMGVCYLVIGFYHLMTLIKE